MFRNEWFVVAVLVVVVCLSMTSVQATTIGPGFDFFSSLPGPLFSLHEFGDLLTFPPPPPVGLVPPDPNAGNTILHRVSPIEAAAGLQLIDIELVALSLQSAEPVSIFDTLFNVIVDFVPPATPLGPHVLDIQPTGEFSLINAYNTLFNISVTPAADPGAPPISLFSGIPQVLFQFQATGTVDLLSPEPTLNWESLSFALLPPDEVPSFIFGPIEHRLRGTIPTSPPPVPEPATLALFGIGLVGMAVRKASK